MSHSEPRIFDCHIHTDVSPDSKMPVEAALAALRSKDLGGIFTEHIDYCPLGGADFIADPARYPSGYLRYKEQYKEQGILLGLEIGLTEKCIEKNRAAVASFPYDYIIGSVHTPSFTGGVDLYFCRELVKSMGDDSYRLYLLSLLDMVQKNESFDALGHIDYIARYHKPVGRPYDLFAEEHTAILKELIARDKILELNTSRFAQEEENLLPIYSRYYELGGRFVTLGSDAHRADRIGSYFPQALKMLDEIGLKPVYFEERKMFV